MKFSMVDTLKSSLGDLRRFPVMLVPLLAASIIVFFLVSLMAGAGIIGVDSNFDIASPTDILLTAVIGLLALAVEFVAFGVLVCLAYDVVVSRIGELANGLLRFKERFKTLLAIAIVFFVAVLAVPALTALIGGLIGGNVGAIIMVIVVVPMLLLALLALFSLVAAIYDGTGAIDSIRAAWSLVFSNLAVMLLFALTTFLIFMVLGFVSSMLALTPVIGNIFSSLILAAFYSFSVDAGMRIYRQLTNN